MTYYTAGYIRDLLKDLPDESPVAGWLETIENCGVEQGDETRSPTPEEWERIVDTFEEYANPHVFNSLWEIMNDSKYEVVPSDD